MPLSVMEEVLLWSTAVATAVITAYLAKRTAEGEGIMGYGYNFFLLTVLVGMPAAALGYLYQPGYIGAFWAVWINMAFMTVGLIPLMYGFMTGLTDYSGRSRYTNVKLGRRRLYRWSAIALILSNEFMMGWVFLLLSGTNIPLYNQSPLLLAEELGSIISSSWFVFTMAIEMIVAIYLFRKKFHGFPMVLLVLQSLIMALTPTALESETWYHWSVLLGNLAMTVLFIISLNQIKKMEYLDKSLKKYLTALFLIYAVMMLGLYAWAIADDTLLLSISIIAEMSLYFGIIIREENFAGQETAQQKKRDWLTMVSSILFSQLLMGGVIVVEELGRNPSAQSGEMLINSSSYVFLFSALAAAFASIAIIYNTIQPTLNKFIAKDAPFFLLGLLLFPFAVIKLDELADANPSFHMLQHLLIGIGGFLAGIALDRMLQARRDKRFTGYFARLDEAAANHAYVTLLIASFIFGIWLEPKLFIYAYQDEVVHGLEHFTILASGILAGVAFYHLRENVRFLLVNIFLWMGPMMLPFSLLLGPYSYEPVYFTALMSEMMGVWLSAIFFIIAISYLEGREPKHIREVEGMLNKQR